jgi:hypothetical protein
VPTNDTARLHAFYRKVFDATVSRDSQESPCVRLSFIDIGPGSAELNVFQTDFGPILSVFFRDPDGLEGKVCLPNPDAQPGVFNPPGTPAAHFSS